MYQDTCTENFQTSCLVTDSKTTLKWDWNLKFQAHENP